MRASPVLVLADEQDRRSGLDVRRDGSLRRAHPPEATGRLSVAGSRPGQPSARDYDRVSQRPARVEFSRSARSIAADETRTADQID